MCTFLSYQFKFGILLLLLSTIQIAYTQTIVSSYTLNSGGHDIRNGEMWIKGSISQPLIGIVHPGPVLNHQGFWYVYTSVRNKTTPLRPLPGQVSKIIVYPNPFSELLYFDISAPQTISNCAIVDMSGKVLQNHVLAGGKSILQLGNLTSGAYLIRVWNGQFLYVRLVIKL